MRTKFILAAFPLFVATSPVHAEARWTVRRAEPLPDRSQVACIARDVYHEARGESATGMVAVGAVALNRVREQGVSACSVVYQRVGGRCQFSWACGSGGTPAGEDWMRSLAVAEALMSSRGLPDPTSGATFFSRCRARPGSGLLRTARIGAHCFWREAVDGVRFGPRGATFGLEQDPSRAHGWAVVVASADKVASDRE